MIWLRSLEGDTLRALAGTEDARSLFWSPDSQWVAFIAKDTLRKMDVAGGRVVTLGSHAFSGGAWSRQGTVVFTQSNNLLAQVSEQGGTVSAVTALDPRTAEYSHVSPVFLPDGRRFIYTALASSGQPTGVYVASLDSNRRSRLPVDAAFVQYADGILFFASKTTLVAQAFDPERATVSGQPVSIAEELRTGAAGNFFSVSETGALVFATAPPPAYELTWFDRAGQRSGSLGSPDDYADVSLSPDGTQAAVSLGEPGTANRDLWLFDVARGVRTRFTSTPGPETHTIWSPDGSRVVFDSQQAGHRDLFQKSSTNGSAEQVLFADEFEKNPSAWSPDGKFILYVKRSGGMSNIWVLPLFGDRKPFPFTQGEFNIAGAFSPDSRWLAYFSRDSGRFEVYVTPFPGPGRKILVSPSGGLDPEWRKDGKEILYLDLARSKLMSAAIEPHQDSVDVGDVKPLFELPKVTSRRSYDITADGQRILALTRKRDESSAPLTLIVNWPALVKN
jgi:Tol biopolymer transport system component